MASGKSRALAMVMNHGLDGDAVVASLFDGPGPTMPDLRVMPIADCRFPDGGWWMDWEWLLRLLLLELPFDEYFCCHAKPGKRLTTNCSTATLSDKGSYDLILNE